MWPNVSIFLFILMSGFARKGLAGLECYECDSHAGDFDSSSACKLTGPDTDDLNRLRAPDEQECYKCYKSVLSSGRVRRGCLSKGSWYSIYRTFDDEEGCRSSVTVDGSHAKKFCACDNYRCNDAHSLTQPATSTTLITVAAVIATSLLERVL